MHNTLLIQSFKWLNYSFSTTNFSREKIREINDLVSMTPKDISKEYFLSIQAAANSNNLINFDSSKKLKKIFDYHNLIQEQNLYLLSKSSKENIIPRINKDSGFPLIVMNDQKKSIEQKTYYTLAYVNSISEDLSLNMLTGLLLYLVQQYRIDLANLVALEILNFSNGHVHVKRYLSFLALNQDNDGSIGVINPLKSSIKEDSVTMEWKRINTLSTVYLIIKIQEKGIIGKEDSE